MEHGLMQLHRNALGAVVMQFWSLLRQLGLGRALGLVGWQVVVVLRCILGDGGDCVVWVGF